MTSGHWACLMYHEVPREASAAGYFAVPRDRFVVQLDAIRALGLSACSLEETLARPAGGLVALTFDDGHETHYQHVFPLLAERQVKGTFFVTSSWVGTPGYVTWPQLREMAAAGMSVQSHTATHPFLSELGSAEAERELATSKAAIEREVGRPCTTLALPGGDAPRGWGPADYARVGFQGVATSVWGPNPMVPGVPPRSSMPFVRRYTVRRDTPDDQLRRMATAADPAYGMEGVRLAALRVLRSRLGPTRYARWRRRVLEILKR
jgi:peptidoglycan/xylan/chitin deacetylase (PgdA/CDA1 family)